MNKQKTRGFTLIELIAIIVVLAAIFLVAFPILLGTTKKTKTSAYDITVENLCEAGKTYIADNQDKYPTATTVGSKITIPLLDLLEYGVIAEDMIDPQLNISLEDSSLIYTVEDDQSLSCGFEEKVTVPIPNDAYCKENLVYTGQIQSLLKRRIPGVIYTNDTATNAGTYTVTALLDDASGYMWEDTTKTAKTFECTINKADDNITIVPVSIVYSNTPINPDISTKSGLPTNKVYYMTSNCSSVATNTKNVGTYYVIANTNGNNNYNSVSSGCKIAGSISSAPLTPTASCQSKTYNGSTAANCTISVATVMQGDSINATASSCQFENANAGTNKTVTCTGITISGTGRANYNLSSTTATARATINKQKVNPPRNLQIAVDGTITWDPPSTNNSTGYQISFNGGTSNASATSGTNYYSTLTSSAGSKTVNVRAINSDTTNYEPSNYINTSIYVYTISVSATNGTISPTPTQANVIAGTSFTTSGQTVTIPRGTSSATFTASKTDKAGYTTTFSGWNPTSGTVNSNTSIVATFTRAAIDYTISYNLNKGSVSTANPAGYNVETATFTLNNPTKTITIKGNENSTSEANGTGVTIGSNTSKAQTFAGWSGTGLSSNSTSVKVTKGSTGNRSYVAHWTAASITLPTVTKTGYTCGWSTSSTGTSVQYASGGTYPASAISETSGTTINVYAVCTINKNKLTVNPNYSTATLDGTTITSSTTIEKDYGQTATIGNAIMASAVDTSGKYTVSFNSAGGSTVNPKDATITVTTSYTFNGWTDSGVCGAMSGTTYTFPANSGTTCTKTPKWVTSTSTAVAAVTLPTSTKTGYTLKNWCTSTNGGGNCYTGSYTPSSNITLYANWEPTVYTITLDKQSGSGGTNSIYEKYNTGYYLNSGATTQITSSANPITKPTRSGYLFMGYYTSTNGGGTKYIDANGYLAAASTTNFTSAGTLYAYWVKDDVNVTYDFNRGTINFAANEYFDTGYVVNWDKDFTITVVANIPSNGNRYLLAGNYYRNTTGTKDLSIEVYSDRTLRVFIDNGKLNGSGHLAYSSDKVPIGSDITYTFTWTAATDSYEFVARNASGGEVARLSGQYSISGTITDTTKKLRSGTQDNRGNATYATYTLKSLKITTIKKAGVDTLSDLPTPTNSTASPYVFTGWFDSTSGGTRVTSASTAPTSNTTYYAQYNSTEAKIGYEFINSSIYFKTCEYLDTGYIVNWNKDFTITAVMNHPSTDKRWSIVSNYYSGAYMDLGLEVNANSKLRVWINGEQRALSSDSVPAGTDITYKFTWTASTKRYTFEAFSGSSTTPIASIPSTYYNASGSSAKSLRAGTIDHRTGDSPYAAGATLKSLVVSTTKLGGTLSDLPTVNAQPVGYNFSGWYTEKSGGTQVTSNTAVPSSDTTYYARVTAFTKGITGGGPYGTQYNGTGNHTAKGWLVGDYVSFTCTGGGDAVPSRIEVSSSSSGPWTSIGTNDTSTCGNHYRFTANYTITQPTENFTLYGRCIYSDNSTSGPAVITGKTIYRRFYIAQNANGSDITGSSLSGGNTWSYTSQYLIADNTTQDGGSKVNLYDITRGRKGSYVEVLGWSTDSGSMSASSLWSGTKSGVGDGPAKWDTKVQFDIYYSGAGSCSNSSSKICARGGFQNYQAVGNIYAISYDTIPSPAMEGSNNGVFLPPDDVVAYTHQFSGVQLVNPTTARMYNTRRYIISTTNGGAAGIVCSADHTIYFKRVGDSTSYQLVYTFASDNYGGSNNSIWSTGSKINGGYAAIAIPLDNYSSTGWRCVHPQGSP